MSNLSDMSFLVQPNPQFGWAAVALTRDSEGVNHTAEPLRIGAGATPMAALLRLITPLREEQPTQDEARLALGDFLTMRGITLNKLSRSVDYSERSLRAILNGDIWIQSGEYKQLAESAGATDQEWSYTLRAAQRLLDNAKELQ